MSREPATLHCTISQHLTPLPTQFPQQIFLSSLTLLYFLVVTPLFHIQSLCWKIYNLRCSFVYTLFIVTFHSKYNLHCLIRELSRVVLPIKRPVPEVTGIPDCYLWSPPLEFLYRENWIIFWGISRDDIFWLLSDECIWTGNGIQQEQLARQ